MLYDDILRHVGEFGPYQATMFVLVSLVNVPTAWQNMAITLVGADMPHWCQVPELQNMTHEQQKYIAVPYEDANEQEYKQCEMYKLNYSMYSYDDLVTWNRSTMVPADIEVVKCTNGWVYDQTLFESTLVSQFDLVCDDNGGISLVQTVYMCGFLVGAFFFGQLADKVGRFKALMLASFMQVVCPLITAFMPVFSAYVAMRFFCGMGSAGGITTLYVILAELIGPTYRVRAVLLSKNAYAIAYMALPGMSYAIRDHIKLQLVMALCPAALWLSFAILRESPRWLIQEGRDEDAIKILTTMAELNDTQLPEKLELEENRKHSEMEILGRTPNVTDLFRTPGLRGVTINSWFNWLATSMVYYGLSLGVDMLPGSIFVNTFIAGAIEVPACLILAFTIDIWGRKWTNFGTLIGAGLSCLLCMIFIEDEERQAASITLLMLGKFFSSGTFDIIYLYATELFPTLVRTVGLGSSSMCGRVGSLLQPQVARLETLWVPGPFLVYGSVSILSGGLALLFPETLGRKLPDTLEEGEAFAKNITFRIRPKKPKITDTVDVDIDKMDPEMSGHHGYGSLAITSTHTKDVDTIDPSGSKSPFQKISIDKIDLIDQSSYL